MKVAVVGATGFLGAHISAELAGTCEVVGTCLASSPIPLEGVRWRRLDVGDAGGVRDFFLGEKPDAVVHAAAMSGLGACRNRPDEAKRVNVLGCKNVAEAAEEVGAYIMFLSTDMVFDGESAPYAENDPPSPVSVYGRTKLEGESMMPPSACVLRLAVSYGKSMTAGARTFFEKALENLRGGKEAVLFPDEWRTPLWANDLARLVPLFLEKRPGGLFHVGGPRRMTRFDMGNEACRVLGLDASRIRPVRREEVASPETRPRDLSLDCSRLAKAFPDFAFTQFAESIELSFGGGA